MINPKELRIGNYVFDSSENEMIQIENCMEIHHLHSCFEPILLTPEILQACGFVSVIGQLTIKIYKLVYKGIDGSLEIHFSEITDEFYLLFISGGAPFSASKRFKYLHQLQNLYYCLTGSELEIEISNLSAPIPS